MYVKRVVLESLRGFERIDFRFDRDDAKYHGWWVITGANASGKTFKTKFPFIQFIVTTHSAMICQAADDDGLFYLLPPGTDESAEQITGSDYLHIIRGKPDEILRGPAFRLLNTRSERVVAARERYARIKAKS